MRPKPLIPILTATEVLLRCVVRESAVVRLQTMDNGVPAGVRRDAHTCYDSTSRPEVFSRAVVKRSCTFAQFAMFQNAFT